MLGGPVDDDLPPVRAVNRLDLLAQLALQPLSPRALPAQLVLEPEDVLDAREIEPELRRQPLDDAQPLEIGSGSGACRRASAADG